MKFMPRLKIWSGSGRKNTFNPNSFEGHSYGWWLYVTKIKGVVIFNDYNYSVTTRKHQSEMSHFLKETMGVTHMVIVNQSESLSSGLFLDYHYNRMALAEVRLKAAKRAEQVKELEASIEYCKKQIATLKKLGATAKMTLVNHRVNAKASEARRLETQRIKSKIARDKRALVVKEFQAAHDSTAAVDV